MEQIQMYGTKYCPDCMRAKAVFSKHKVIYDWHDIDDDTKAAEYVEKVNGGFKSVPTILFPDGAVLVEPSNPVLEKKLKELLAR